jgi:hypothetical protein
VPFDPIDLSPALWLQADEGTYTDASIHFVASDKSYLQTNWGAAGYQSDRTVSLWVKFDSTDNCDILGVGSSPSGVGLWRILVWYSDIVVQHGATNSVVLEDFDTDQWYHVVYTYKHSTTTEEAWIDGVRAHSNTRADTQRANTNLYLGNGNLGHFDGSLDSLQIWSRTLTDDEIAVLYNSGAGLIHDDLGDDVSLTGLEGSWDLGEEGSMQTRYDSSGNGRDFTPVYDSIIAPAEYGDELVTDGEFANWTGGNPDDWGQYPGNGTITEDTTIYKSGGSSCKMSYVTGSAYIRQNFSVVAGRTYRLQFWTRGDGTHGGFYRLRDNTNIEELFDPVYMPTGVDGTEWQLITEDFVAPAGCSSVRLFFYSYFPGVAADVWYDLVSVKEVTSPGINNGGFESWTEPSSRSNLISNSSFETAGAGGADVWADWTETAGSGAIANETTNVHYGSNAAKLSYVTGNATIRQNVTVTAGAVYKLTFWTRGDGSNDGKYSIYDNDNSEYIVDYSDTGNATTSYAKVTEIFKVPSGCTSIRILFGSHSNVGDAYFDDVELVEVASVLDDWSGNIAGDSFRTRVDESPYSGSHAITINRPASGGSSNIRQLGILTDGKEYDVSFRAKIDDDSGSGEIQTSVGGATETHTLTTSWAEYTATKTSEGDNLYVNTTAACEDKTVSIDQVTLKAAEIQADAGIARGLASDQNFGIEFDGSSDYLSYSGTAFNPGTGDCSVGFVFTVSDLPTSGLDYLFGMWNASNDEISVSVSSTGKLRVRIEDGDDHVLSEYTDNSVDVNTWYVAVLCLDYGGNVDLYVNNVSWLSEDIGHLTGDINPGNLTLGAQEPTGSYKCDCTIDNAFYANRLLTSEERTWLFNDGKFRQYSEIETDQPSLASAIVGMWEGDDADDLGADSTGNLGDELLEDGGIETWPLVHWTPSGTVTQETSDIHGGSSAAKIEYDGGPSQIIGGDSLTDGSIYRLSFWYKGTGTPQYCVVGSGYVVFWVNLDTAESDYRQITVEFTANQTGNHAIYFSANEPGEVLYVDDVSLKQTNNLTVNGSPTQTQGVNYLEGQVGYWQDQSGNGNNATQLTLSKRPSFLSNALNSLPVVRFDGVDDYLDLTGLTSTTGNYTFFFVLASRASGTDYFFDSQTGRLIIYTTSTNQLAYHDGSDHLSENGVLGSDFQIVSVVLDSESNSGKGYVDGVIKVEDTFAAKNIGGAVVLCGRYTKTQYLFDADIAEIIVYSSALSDTQRALVYDWLYYKWFVASSPAAAYFRNTILERSYDMREIQKDQSTAAKRRVYFHLVDGNDGLTAETGEADGQPQISVNGATWTDTGIGVLVAVGNGEYYAELTEAILGTSGDVIRTRYSSANTAECKGETIKVVNYDPDVVWSGLIDTLTPQQALQIIFAGASGDLSGAGSGTEVLLGGDNSTTRITATVDSSGNRSSVYNTD